MSEGNYCIMRAEKITTTKALDAAYRHVYRKDCPLNADPEKSHRNIYDIHQLNDDGTQMSYMDSFRRRIHQLPYYQDHKIRSNAVLGIDILFSYSKSAEGTFDEQAWMEKNAKWLNDTFSVAPDGRSNVISVVYHEDEHSFHGHAYVIPIDERGRLNCRRFMNGTLGQYQSSYAKEMEEFGLDRGIEGSTADHRTMSRMYAKANEAAKVPLPKAGESAMDYYHRINETARTMNLQMYHDACEKIDRHREKSDRELQKSRELLKKESDMIRLDSTYVVNEAQQKIERASALLETMAESFATQMESLVAVSEDPQTATDYYIHYTKLLNGLHALERSDPQKASELAALITEAEAIGTQAMVEKNKEMFRDILESPLNQKL